MRRVDGPRTTDERSRILLEGLARQLDRRAFLDRALRTGFALAAGLALGTTQVVEVLAANGNCKACTYPYGRTCNHLGYPCPSSFSCPSGCKACKSTDGCDGYGCIYSAGYWLVTGCGVCGVGTRRCSDCVCPSTVPCLATTVCGCRSGCNCCNCCSPQDVAREMKRVASERAREAA